MKVLTYEEKVSKKIASDQRARTKFLAKPGKPLKRSRIVSKAPKKVKTEKTLSKLKKELDAVFSRYIRYRDKGQCYTCPKKDDPKRMQNGHFVPRQYLAVRFSEINCHCQCYACNMLYNGQPSAYAARLKRDYGEGVVERLEAKRQEITKFTPFFYTTEIARYEELLKSPSV